MGSRATQRPAQHVLSFWGEEVSVDDVLARLQHEGRSHSGSGISTLNLGHNPLLGRRIGRLLAALTDAGPEESVPRKETLPRWALRALYPSLDSIELPRLQHTHSMWAIRTLNLNRCNLDSAALRLVGEYVQNNGALVSLSVSGNDFTHRHIDEARVVRLLELAIWAVQSHSVRQLTHLADAQKTPEVLEDVKSFARALRYSNISKLSLSTHLGISGFIAFANTLRSASIADLELTAMWTAGEGSTDENFTGLHAARALACLIISQRCPRLQTLKSNANDYGWRGRRTIIGAVVGSDAPSSHARRLHFLPCRSMTLCELYGTVEYNSKPPQSPSPKSTPIEPPPTGTLRVPPRAEQCQLFASPHIDALEDAAFSSVGYEEPNEALHARLALNRREGFMVQLRAAKVLRIARVLGCCARALPIESQDKATVFAFASLPPEVRLLIVREVDSERTLSATQFDRVISWACERATIGAGNKDLWQDTAEHGFELDAEAEATLLTQTPPDAHTTGLLPAQKWSWPHLTALCGSEEHPQHSLPGTLPCNWLAMAFDDHPGNDGGSPSSIGQSVKRRPPRTADWFAFVTATATRAAVNDVEDAGLGADSDS